MKACWRVAVRELRAIARTKHFLALAIIVPIGYALIFSAVYWNQKVTGIPVTIVDMDHSSLSREVTRGILSSETFRLAGYSDSAESFPTLAATGKANVCFIFPYHFEKDVKSGRGSKVAVWVDASNILIGNVAITSAANTLGTYSVGVDVRKSLLRGRATTSTAASVVQPVRDEWRVWYNPAMNFNYANFMLLGLVVTAIQLLTVLFAARAGSREYEDATVGELKTIGASAWSLALGKCFAYVAIMMPVSFLALYLPGKLLGVPMVGSEWLLAGYTAWFISIWVMVAIGISALVKDSLMTLEAFVIVVMPSYLLSGNTWPNFAMPAGMQVVSYILPLSHYVMIVRKITMMGASPDCFGREMAVMGVWSVISLMLAYLGAWKLVKSSANYEGVRS